jgi:uncharacterized membrane protein YesL
MRGGLGEMFNMDGKFFEAMSRVADLVILNLLFLLCSIPILTMGAAVTAMYDVTKQMAENRESYIVRSFFHSFRENLKASTKLWLILLFILLILITDMNLCHQFASGMTEKLIEIIILLPIILVKFMILYSLTLQSTFENTIGQTLKNALLISLAHAPWSILMCALTLLPFGFLIFVSNSFRITFWVMVLIWFSATAYINSGILSRIYKKYM